MSWEDRDYNREGSAYRSGGGGDFLYALNRIFNWSFSIGRYFGIRVRVHITFIFALLYFWDAAGRTWWALVAEGLLFLSVLLHEFGHCFGCRSVGGEANDILMWPLGGLAFCAPPKRVWPEFVTVACGPLVNVVLAVGAYGALLALGFADLVRINPLDTAVGLKQIEAAWHLYLLPPWAHYVVQGLVTLFTINYGLLLFNLLLVFYPFDGGRLVQIAIWKFAGYYKSMYWATRIGIVGAVLVSVYGIYARSPMLVIIAVFGGITCYQQMLMLAHNADEHLYDVGYYNTRRAEGPRRKGALGRWRERRAPRRSRAEAASMNALHVEVDRILDKVKKHGLQSLTAREKRTLQKATEEQRRAG